MILLLTEEESIMTPIQMSNYFKFRNWQTSIWKERLMILNQLIVCEWSEKSSIQLRTNINNILSMLNQLRDKSMKTQRSSNNCSRNKQIKKLQRKWKKRRRKAKPMLQLKLKVLKEKKVKVVHQDRVQEARCLRKWNRRDHHAINKQLILNSRPMMVKILRKVFFNAERMSKIREWKQKK